MQWWREWFLETGLAAGLYAGIAYLIGLWQGVKYARRTARAAVIDLPTEGGIMEPAKLLRMNAAALESMAVDMDGCGENWHGEAATLHLIAAQIKAVADEMDQTKAAFVANLTVPTTPAFCATAIRGECDAGR